MTTELYTVISLSRDVQHGTRSPIPARLSSLAAGLAAALGLSLLGTPAAHAASGATHPPTCSGSPVQPSQVIDLPAADTTTTHAEVIARGRATYRWGSAIWLEPSYGCASFAQTFDFFPAEGPTGNDANAVHPTIVYFHPNAASSKVRIDGAFGRNVIQPALAAGYNVVSVEFRHPVIDQYLAPQLGGQVPHQDTGLAIQYLRAHARSLGISSDNLFAFGYSRGSLALWQALQPDLGGGTTGKPSSKVSGFFGYQAQTTYQCQQYAQRFLVASDPNTQSQVDACLAENWYDAQFGSALDSVTASSLPVRLQYQQGLELVPGTKKKIQLVTVPYLLANYETEHYPDFGMALYNAYRAVGNTRISYPETYVTADRQFTGWQDFVTPLLK